MKIIHCADVHLGSKMEAKLPKDKIEERKAEVRATFNRMLDYARSESVRAIILAGDVFDSDRPLKKDKEFFYDAVRSNPQIDFLYLRGNHDGKESYTEHGLENLKTFGSEWTVYSYDDIDIWGIEMSADNAVSLYSTLHLDAAKKNIVMLHGQEGEACGKDKINIPKLKGKNIDYLALGHLHSYKEKKLDERGVYAYSGCLEGRGFDETGAKGFILIDSDKKISGKFIEFCTRKIVETQVDLTGTENSYQALQKIKSSVSFERRDIVRVELVGEILYDNDTLARELEKYLADDYYFVSVKDGTARKLDIKDYEGDVSLKGEFVRTVLADASYSEEKKRQIIALGLKALSGREVE